MNSKVYDLETTSVQEINKLKEKIQIKLHSCHNVGHKEDVT